MTEHAGIASQFAAGRPAVLPYVMMPADLVSEISRFGFPKIGCDISSQTQQGKWGLHDRSERSRLHGLAELLIGPPTDLSHLLRAKSSPEGGGASNRVTLQ